MDTIIDYFSQHHDHFFYVVACLCLLLELGILGMSGPLLFIALGCFASGILITFNIIHGWPAEFLTMSVFAVVGAAVLWKPLKKFQNAAIAPDTSSDMIGRSLPVVFAITRDQGRVSYSGIEWQARLDASVSEPIAVASHALVVRVDGSLLIVKQG